MYLYVCVLRRVNLTQANESLPEFFREREALIRVPPPVGLHFLASRQERLRHLLVLLVGKVEGEEAAASAHPAQSQAFGAQVVLEHPVVAARLLEEHGPHRGEGIHPEGEGFRLWW